MMMMARGSRWLLLLILLAATCWYRADGISRVPSLLTVRTKQKQSAALPLGAKISKNPILIATETRENQINGVSCMIGGALAHLTLGTMFCWGNFLSYAPQYLKFFDGKGKPNTPPDALFVIPFALVAQAIAMPLGPMLSARVGAQKGLLIGSLLTALATYLSSYQTTLLSFILTYSLLFGTGVGLAYTAPMVASWKWLPSKKGLASGCIQAGFGLGGFVFSLIGRRFVNPDGLNPTNGLFPQSVYDNFPGMLRRLGLIYAAVSLVASIFIVEPPPSPATATPSGSPGLTVWEAIATRQFWQLWAMIVSSAMGGLTTAALFKQLALRSPALAGDGFQALVGGIGALFNGGGRVFWGLIADRLGFRWSFRVLALLQTALLLSFRLSLGSKPLFAATVWLLFFCLAGTLSLLPPATVRLYGGRAGTTIYGLLFSGFAVASLLGGWLAKQLAVDTLFSLMAVLSLLAAALCGALSPIASLPASQL